MYNRLKISTQQHIWLSVQSYFTNKNLIYLLQNCSFIIDPLVLLTISGDIFTEKTWICNLRQDKINYLIWARKRDGY